MAALATKKTGAKAEGLPERAGAPEPATHGRTMRVHFFEAQRANRDNRRPRAIRCVRLRGAGSACSTPSKVQVAPAEVQVAPSKVQVAPAEATHDRLDLPAQTQLMGRRAFDSTEELGEWLRSYGLNTARWAQGDAKDVGALLHELNEGECVLRLEDRCCTRLLRVAKVGHASPNPA